MKPVFLTFIYDNDLYVKFGLKLLNKFKANGYETFVYTNKTDLFDGHSVIPYTEEEFSYHHKIFAVEYLYNSGYKHIFFLDADLVIFDDCFFNDLTKLDYVDGISYTRNGEPNNLEDFIKIKNLNLYKNSIEKYNIGDLKKIESIWEDVIFFNFNNLDPTSFFTYYKELTELKHSADRIRTTGERFGDQEGYTVSISAKLTNIPIQINEGLKESIKNLRAINYTYDDILKPILNEMDIIIPYRKDSNEREKNLITILNYYRRHFKDSNFIISEQGNEKTIGDIFNEVPLPHNQSKCINDGIRFSNKKYVCVIDCDIILLNYMNIHSGIRDMFMDEFDYCLPYTECFDLPNFDVRRPWGGRCVGGIFIIDKNKFIEAGMNNEMFVGWGREDDERHQRLINFGLRFKRMEGNIIHLYHPTQTNIDETSETNFNLLKEIKNDNSYFNKI